MPLSNGYAPDDIIVFDSNYSNSGNPFCVCLDSNISSWLDSNGNFVGGTYSWQTNGSGINVNSSTSSPGFIASGYSPTNGVPYGTSTSSSIGTATLYTTCFNASGAALKYQYNTSGSSYYLVAKIFTTDQYNSTVISGSTYTYNYGTVATIILGGASVSSTGTVTYDQPLYYLNSTGGYSYLGTPLFNVRYDAAGNILSTSLVYSTSYNFPTSISTTNQEPLGTLIRRGSVTTSIPNFLYYAGMIFDGATNASSLPASSSSLPNSSIATLGFTTGFSDSTAYNPFTNPYISGANPVTQYNTAWATYNGNGYGTLNGKDVLMMTFTFTTS